MKPIHMLLWCPGCGARHIDEGEFADKEHHTHACQSCGMVWRPAIEPTVGVQFLPGFKNKPKAGLAEYDLITPAKGFAFGKSSFHGTISGYPLGSEEDNAYHRATGEQIPKEDPIPEYDATRPGNDLQQQVSLTKTVLDQFIAGTGPLTASDARRINRTLGTLWQALCTSERIVQALKANPPHVYGERPKLGLGGHLFYKTGDPDAPQAIKDGNGEVVLDCCRVCNQAESELDDKCPGAPVRDSSKDFEAIARLKSSEHLLKKLREAVHGRGQPQLPDTVAEVDRYFTLHGGEPS